VEVQVTMAYLPGFTLSSGLQERFRLQHVTVIDLVAGTTVTRQTLWPCGAYICGRTRTTNIKINRIISYGAGLGRR
jgi:hypothetical protein